MPKAKRRRKTSTITIKGPIPTNVLRALGFVKTADALDRLGRGETDTQPAAVVCPDCGQESQSTAICTNCGVVDAPNP